MASKCDRLLERFCWFSQVFLNLYAFVTALLPSVGAAAFRPWAQTFVLRMVAASGRLPQLSGFYHIICTSMQLAKSAGLLDDQQVLGSCF